MRTFLLLTIFVVGAFAAMAHDQEKSTPAPAAQSVPQYALEHFVELDTRYMPPRERWEFVKDEGGEMDWHGTLEACAAWMKESGSPAGYRCVRVSGGDSR